ncbi:MAG: hypothetical protein WCY25_08945 [Moheibacter sp.]
MNSINTHLFCLMLLAGLAGSGWSYAQSQDESQFNLPPGYYLNPSQPIFDLSWKLDGSSMDKEIPAAQLQVLKALSEEELANTSAEYQAYVREGKDFINALSANIKSLYSEQELWYIFAFDSELRNQLLQTQ